MSGYSNLIRQATYKHPGDFLILAGEDPSNGTGLLQVADYIETLSSSNATGAGTGALRLTNGGLYVGLDSYHQGQLVTIGPSILQQLDVTTNNGPLNVHGSGAIALTSTASPITLQTIGLQSINFLSGNIINSTVTSGDYNINLLSGNYVTTASGNVNFILSGAGDFVARTTKGQVSLTGTNGKSNAIVLANGDSASGIMMSAGSSGVSVNSTGPIVQNASGGASSFNLTTTGDTQDLSLKLSGASLSRVVLSSAGTGLDAIYTVALTGGITQSSATKLIQTVSNGPFVLTSSSQSSSITHNMTADLQNLSFSLLSPSSSSGFNGIFNITSNGNSATAFTVNAPYGGYTSTNILGHSFTSSSGAFRLISSGGTTPCRIASAVTSDSQDFTIALTDASASKQSRLILFSQCPPNDAVRLAASNGGISLNSNTQFTSNTSNGTFSITASIPPSTTTGGCSITELSSASGQDFTIALSGTNGGPGTSRLNLTSAGTGVDALNFSTSAGGMTAQSVGPMFLDSSNTSTGINIGTKTVNVPIYLGRAGNQVLCNSDITFTGNLTFATNSTIPVETQQLLVQDRSIVINSTPVFSGDAALLLQRFQSTPNGISDDVVTDTPTATGIARSGTTSTIVLSTAASNVTGFYVGFYIYITAGTGRGFVTQITAYNGSTMTATVSPNFTTAPDNTSAYSLYGNVFAGLAFRSGNKRFELLYSATNYETSSTIISPTAYAPLYLQNLQTVPGSGAIQTDTINGSTGSAVTISGVLVNNSTLSNVTSINNDLPSTVTTISLTVANGSSSAMIIPGLTASTLGVFLLLINADQNSNPGGPVELWSLCKTSSTRAGACTKLSSQSGSTKGEALSIRWPASAGASITYDTSLLSGTLLPASGTYKFIVKTTRTLNSI